MNKAAFFYVIYWEDTLVGMISILNSPSGSMKYAFRIHRIVILPDFQGLGMGTKIIDFFGKYFLDHGNKLFIKTTHIRFARHCLNSDAWVETAESQRSKSAITGQQSNKYRNMSADHYRVAYSFEYVGSDYTQKEHQYIVCMGDCSLDRAMFRIKQVMDSSKCSIIISGIANQKEITVWEEAAKELHLRRDILFSKSNGEFSLIQKYLKDFDCVICGKESLQIIQPYMSNAHQKYIA